MSHVADVEHVVDVTYMCCLGWVMCVFWMLFGVWTITSFTDLERVTQAATPAMMSRGRKHHVVLS